MYVARLLAFAGILIHLVPGPLLARDWTDKTGNHITEADFVASSENAVRLKTKDDRTIEVPLEKLSETDRRYVRYKVGLRVRDLSGVWRTARGSHYTFVDRGDAIDVKLHDSPVLQSVDASLRRTDSKVVARFWRVVFKDDPSKETRNISVQLYQTMDGQVRGRFDKVFWNANGAEIGRKKGTTPLVRLTEEQTKEYFQAQARARRAAERESEQILLGAMLLIYGVGKVASWAAEAGADANYVPTPKDSPDTKQIAVQMTYSDGMKPLNAFPPTVWSQGAFGYNLVGKPRQSKGLFTVTIPKISRRIRVKWNNATREIDVSGGNSFIESFGKAPFILFQ